MITIVYSTRKENPSFQEELRKTIGVKKYQILEYTNDGKYSLTELYNRGLKEAENDIVVFCHDDIYFEKKNWGSKLIKAFKRNDDFGIIGIAGGKRMPESGRWWDNPSDMVGVVNHEHEGKKWTNTYSDNLGNILSEVVLVDGLFFAVKKDRIKKTFNEEVKGFHFYDVDFSLSNHLAGVKVGVTFEVRVTHRSIGMTNEEWEKNRETFVENNKDVLPVRIKRYPTKHEKVRVLIACLNFNSLTGSELYVYELAKSLVERNCEVTICSNVGGDLAKRAKRLGIKLASLEEPPGYIKGDGRSVLNTPNGQVKMEEGKLYAIGGVKFDLLHLNHTPITEYMLRLYPQATAISTIHSEVISLENPVIHENIKKYIAIRPEIKQHLIENHNIDEDKIEVIYNPIDDRRFNSGIKAGNDKKIVLFVGTIDYLRKNTIMDLIETTKSEGSELWIVGAKKDTYLDGLNEEHVKYFSPCWDVEKYVKKCDETASVLLGRTTIEGWLCHKPGWIYDIDDKGEIRSKELQSPPEDIDKFKSSNVIDGIIEEYVEII